MSWSLSWHYSTALSLIWQIQTRHFQNIAKFIGFKLLLTSLFSPWKRQTVTNSKKGFSLSAKWDTSSFNIISRSLGLFIRLWILVFGLLALIIYGLFSVALILVYILFPPLSYQLWRHWHQLPTQQHYPTQTADLISSKFGQFILSHTGLQPSDIPNQKLPTITSTHELIDHLLVHVIHPDTLQARYVHSQDLQAANRWWEIQTSLNHSLLPPLYSGKSLALDLSQGYTPTLDKYSSPLQTSAPLSSTKLLTHLSTSFQSGNHLLIYGQPGIGKKTLLSNLAYLYLDRLVFKFVNFNDLLSQVLLDINSKKHVLASALKEASLAGNTVLVFRDLHRFTHSTVEGFDFTDTLEAILESGKIQAVSLCTNTEYERYIQPNARLRKLFDIIEVKEPDAPDILDILIHHAIRLEALHHITVPTPILRFVFDYSNRYILDLPQPQKSLKLLDSTIGFARGDHSTIISKLHVDQAISHIAGINVGALNQSDRSKLANLETRMKNRLVGQDLAISLIARSLRSRSTGLSSQSRPTGSFLFLGPTGVGKTETAKALAESYFGSESKMIRFDMAEFAHRDGPIRLLGSPEHNQPGLLASSIKSNPESIILLDEIEKAPAEVYNVFLTLLDEGYISDAFGQKINCNHTLIIATSNAASTYIRELVSKGVSGESLHQQVVEHILQQGWFSPEFINRFDSVVVYQPLSPTHLGQIANLQLSQLTSRLKAQNITLNIDPTVIPKICSLGYNPTFGARPMRRIVDLVIGDLFSQGILNSSINPGDSLLLYVNAEDNFVWKKVQTHS